MATTLKKYILKSKNDFVLYAVTFLGSHMQFAKKGTNLFRLNWVCKKMPKKQYSEPNLAIHFLWSPLDLV